MADSSHRVTIAVAIIGVMGTLGAALIANWDKVFPPAPQPLPKPAPAPAPRPIDGQNAPVRAAPTPQVAGLWRDADNPNIGTNIAQDGTRLKFTRAGILPNGTRFEITDGTGGLVDSQITLRYLARYHTGSTSKGECSGTVAPGARQITLNCADSLVGTFVTVVNRM